MELSADRVRSKPMPWGEVFQGLPPDLTRVQTLFFDAVDLLLPACQLQYARIREGACQYTQAQSILDDASSDDDLAQRARDLSVDLQTVLIADCGSFVATVQRLRRVVHRLRGDTVLRIAKKAFESAVASNENARHYLEHLDTAIPAVVPTGHGALGSLSWHYADESKVGVLFIIPGHSAEGATAGLRMASSVRRPVDHVWATIAGTDYHLTGAADAVDALRERLNTWSAGFIAPVEDGA
jgi:hypothetical protein